MARAVGEAAHGWHIEQLQIEEGVGRSVPQHYDCRTRRRRNRNEHGFRISRRSPNAKLTGFFASPVAYVFIVIFLLLCGFFTFMPADFLSATSIARGVLHVASLVLSVLVPAVGMRLWSEERRQGTMELLLTMADTRCRPSSEIPRLVDFLMLRWRSRSRLDHRNYWAIRTRRGRLLVSGQRADGGGYLAIAGMTSAMTRNQVVSFILSVVICLFLILAVGRRSRGCWTRWIGRGFLIRRGLERHDAFERSSAE